MCEFAPGSPWKTIFSRLADAVMAVLVRDKMIRSTARQHDAGSFEVVWRIDTERHRIHDRHVDPHAGFKRAQLLELFAPLQCRRGQADEPLKRRPPISVKSDVVIERSVSVGCGRPGEVERPQPAPSLPSPACGGEVSDRRADNLDDV